MQAHRVVIVGGGTGGLKLARKLGLQVQGNGGVVGSRTNRRCLPLSLRYGSGVTPTTPVRPI